MNIKNDKRICNEIRKEIVKMHSRADASHIGSSLSCVDILVSLYFYVMKLNKRNKDRFILSKGHAVSALYATLAQKGLINTRLLKNYCCTKTALPGHCTRGLASCIEASTGSLGHGLSIGAGMALAAKHDRLTSRVFVLLSDGECDEGSVWEAALFASHHKLDNLIAIIDYNKLQAFGRTEEILALEPLSDKWESFGWGVREIDGHDCEKITTILNKAPFKKNRPSVVIAHTTKGKGISFMENSLLWHYKSPQGEEYKKALEELEV